MNNISNKKITSNKDNKVFQEILIEQIDETLSVFECCEGFYWLDEEDGTSSMIFFKTADEAKRDAIMLTFGK